jgi:hypothetical protein
MHKLLSARHGLGGRLRRYQHDRLGIITTVTLSAAPGAQIIRIYRRQDPQAMAGLHSALLESEPTKNPIADKEIQIKATESFHSDVAAALCPKCKTRPPGAIGLLCLDCLLAKIAQLRGS